MKDNKIPISPKESMEERLENLMKKFKELKAGGNPWKNSTFMLVDILEFIFVMISFIDDNVVKSKERILKLETQILSKESKKLGEDNK